jgi:hypothetical protein
MYNPFIFISNKTASDNATNDEVHYWMYFVINFRWKSDRIESLIKLCGFLSSVPFAQFLKTTSSSHRRLTEKLDGACGCSNGLASSKSSCLIFSYKH